jgi:3-hydroxymyristoyl/3-hydroxydecanoyl-(acyl carrier protein) dehydratase
VDVGLADDPVMPGTLMYECCLHTLRVLLLRWGWLGEAGAVVPEPIPGRSSALACRGQVLGSTRTVQYRLDVVEQGFEPDGTPWVIAEALMSADGRPVVRMSGMSLRLRGLTRAGIERLWASRRCELPVSSSQPSIAGSSEFRVSSCQPFDGQAKTQLPPRLGSVASTGAVASARHHTSGNLTLETRNCLYDNASITAFAEGDPSAAFGDRYRIFDRERRIARLPRAPYKFLDRIVAIEDAQPWVMRACGPIVAEYDVPRGAWYFTDGHGLMPFAVLLEVALQPCGWLAAYCGSALTSAVDLRFRNLGGEAVQHRAVAPDCGLLRTSVRMSQVSNSGGMIIQHYAMAVTDAQGRPVYEGTTYFGFFSAAALANQVGIRDAVLHQPTAPAASRPYPEGFPYARDRMRMLDEVVHLEASGGPAGLGYAQCRLRVDPAAWFFQAHFYQDPVCPGSLGLESVMQALALLAVQRWGAGRLVALAEGRRHRWTYRGQVVPADAQVTVQTSVSAWDDAARVVTADGWLSVDGRVIYRLQDFALRLEPAAASIGA